MVNEMRIKCRPHTKYGTKETTFVRSGENKFVITTNLDGVLLSENITMVFYYFHHTHEWVHELGSMKYFAKGDRGVGVGEYGSITDANGIDHFT